MQIDWDRIGEDEVKIAEAVADELQEKVGFDMTDGLMMTGAVAAPMIPGVGQSASMGLDALFDSYFVSDAVDRRTDPLDGMRLDSESGLWDEGSVGGSSNFLNST